MEIDELVTEVPTRLHRARAPRRILSATLIGLALAAIALSGYEAITWPNVWALRTQNPKTTAFIELYQAQRKAAGRSTAVAWQPVPYDRISANLKRAVLVGEDIGFFQHNGFAVDEIRNAVEEALRGERLRGASTITQQLAKNLWLSPSRNPTRKLKEALLTWQLEHVLGKRRILELYLNVVEFGPGIYGAEAAARHYFAEPASMLTEEQAAEMAAALPRPSDWHPGSERQGYLQHVARIEGWMERATFLWKFI